MKLVVPMPVDNAPLHKGPAATSIEAWLALPKDLPRRCLALVPWLLLLADADGLVPQARLVELLGFTDGRNVRTAITALEMRGIVARVPAKKLRKLGLVGGHVRVVWGKILSRSWRSCANCPRPVQPVRGARFCPVCQATMGREDRSWKAIAFERWVQGRLAKETESKIAYAISKATQKPLFTPKRHEGDVDNADEGIVNFCLREGWFTDETWRAILRAHGQGEEGEA